MHNFFWVKDVPFNCIFLEELKNAGEIAKILQKSEDEQFFIYQRTLITQAMRDLMFDDGIYYSTQGFDYKKIKVNTWAMFAPLFAGILSGDEAQRIMEEQFLNFDHFHTTYLLPTVSKNEPSFSPDGFWRGPVWMSVNWFIFQGIQKYGFKKEAQKILDCSMQLLEKSGFREQYNPLTGEGLGAKNFTWGGLILDMLEL